MLKQKSATTNHRFTGGDLDFLASVLVPGEQRQHVEKLWTDPDALREMLDLNEVFRSLLDSPATLQVSARFYFYVLVRHAFLQSELPDPDLADYVAKVMTKSVYRSNHDSLNDVAGGFTHASDYIAVISSAKGRMRFLLQVTAGNQFMMLAGLYPDFLKARCEKSGAQDPEYYQNFAQHAFRAASTNLQAPSKSSRIILSNLADSLPIAIRSLNRVAEEFLFLGD